MKWVLVATIWASIAAVVVLAGVPMMMRSRFRRRHRINPAIDVDVPLWWAVSPGHPARLHRRLCRAVSLAREAIAQRQPTRMARLGHRLARGGAMPTLKPLIGPLETKAIAIDRHLADLRTLPKAQQAEATRVLAWHTQQVEDIAGQLALLTLSDGASARSDTVASLAHQIAKVGSTLPPIDTEALPAAGGLPAQQGG